MSLNSIILILSYASLFVLALTGLFFFKKTGKIIKVLIFYFLLSCLVESICLVLANYHLNNIRIYNIYNPIEYLLVSYIFLAWLKSKWLFQAILILSFIYIIIWAYTTFIYIGFENYNFYIRMFQSVIMVFLSGFLLVQVSSEIKIPLLHNEKFWVALAFFFFYAVNVIIFTFSGIILTSFGGTFNYALLIKLITELFSNLIFIKAILCNSQKRKSFSPYLL